MQPVKAEPQKSQVDTRSQVQASKCKRDTKTQAGSLSTVYYLILNNYGFIWCYSVYKRPSNRYSKCLTASTCKQES